MKRASLLQVRRPSGDSSVLCGTHGSADIRRVHYPITPHGTPANAETTGAQDSSIISAAGGT